MDRVLTMIPADRPIYVNTANPVDIHLNVAVQTMARKCLPKGYHVVERFEDAPTTLDGITAYAQDFGVLCVASEDSAGTIYDDIGVNVDLRAWHDSIHYRYQFAFNVAGEAAVTYIQVAQMYRVYGYNEKTIKWAQLLLADILGLVIHNKMTGKYPKNKRSGTLNAAPRWRAVAVLIGLACTGSDHELKAALLAEAEWGKGV